MGVWVPLESEMSIPWQHPAQMATCYRVNIQTKTNTTSLLKARALFADATFNMSIDLNGWFKIINVNYKTLFLGHLNVKMYDGFFFVHNITYDKLLLNNDEAKDIAFCATRKFFNLTVSQLINTISINIVLDKRRTSCFSGRKFHIFCQF